MFFVCEKSLRRLISFDFFSHYNVGNRYIGQGEFTKAVEHFMQAAMGGSSLGMYNLGVANLKGAAGLPVNITESRKWFERCGTGDGAYALATTFAAGSVERKRWYDIAKQRGSTDAATMLVQEYGRDQVPVPGERDKLEM